MKNRFLILSFALLLFFSCRSSDAVLNDYNCMLSFSDAGESVEADDRSDVETLRKRIESVAKGDVTLEKSSANGNWTLSFRSELGWDEVEKLLTTEGRFGIWETYSWNDISELGDYIMNTAMQDLDSYESLGWHLDDSRNLIKLSGLSDDELRNAKRLVEQAAQAGLIPRRMVISESVNPDGSTDVYILKSTSAGDAAIDNRGIASVEAIKSKSGEQSGVTITFTETAKESFRALTASNIRRTLIFMLDDTVLIEPMVNSEIPGGKCFVWDDSTPLSPDVLSAILSSKPLHHKVTVQRQ